MFCIIIIFIKFQSNLDYPDFSIVWTISSGSRSFSWWRSLENIMIRSSWATTVGSVENESKTPKTKTRRRGNFRFRGFRFRYFRRLYDLFLIWALKISFGTRIFSFQRVDVSDQSVSVQTKVRLYDTERHRIKFRFRKYASLNTNTLQLENTLMKIMGCVHV